MQKIPAHIQDEIWGASVHSPFALANLRRQVDEELFSSDATLLNEEILGPRYPPRPPSFCGDSRR